MIGVLKLKYDLFQSTRPHGARPINKSCLRIIIAVSIHAPAWGATRVSQRQGHTTNSFNPRARMGRDPYFGGVTKTNQVSIHAPAWGATGAVKYYAACFLRFNPRARMGRDCGTPITISAFTLFQSTRPHGARHESRPIHL